ncbi:MAG: hypothetical protein R2909_20215 [Gemmatimonadales bacterium]
MHDDDNSRRERAATREDRKFQRTVLDYVIYRHPTHLRWGELVLEITAGKGDREDLAAIEAAIHDLAGAGLVHLRCGLVAPSNAALHFARLSEED